MKKIKGMMGYDHKDIMWEEMEVVSTVKTNGTDCNGYKESEIIGVAINQYGENCIFRGSVDDEFQSCQTVIMSTDGKDLPTLLRELADNLELQLKPTG